MRLRAARSTCMRQLSGASFSRVGQDAARQGASLAARNFVFRVDGNPYGRRTAGSVYRDELEEVLTGKLSQEYDFQRGTKVFLDRQVRAHTYFSTISTTSVSQAPRPQC